MDKYNIALEGNNVVIRKQSDDSAVRIIAARGLVIKPKHNSAMEFIPANTERSSFNVRLIQTDYEGFSAFSDAMVSLLDDLGMESQVQADLSVTDEENLAFVKGKDSVDALTVDDLTVNNDAEIEGNLEVGADANVTGNLEVGGDADVTGEINGTTIPAP